MPTANATWPPVSPAAIDRLTAAEKKITDNATALAAKAAASDLASLATAVNANTTAISGKASASSVSALQTQVDSNTSALGNKASASSVSALQSQVDSNTSALSNKADSSAVPKVIAPFSASATYKTGDVAISPAGAMIQAKANISAGAYNASQWNVLLTSASTPTPNVAPYVTPIAPPVKPKRLWPLQESSGTSGVEVIASGGAVSLQGAAAFGGAGPDSARSGGTALDLTASGAYATAPIADIIQTSSRLWAMWVYITNSNVAFFCEGNNNANNGFGLYWDTTSGNGFRANIFGKALTGGNNAAVLNQWKRVAAWVPKDSSEPGGMRLYIDGVLISYTGTVPNPPTTTGISIGALANGAVAADARCRIARLTRFDCSWMMADMLAAADFAAQAPTLV